MGVADAGTRAAWSRGVSTFVTAVTASLLTRAPMRVRRTAQGRVCCSGGAAVRAAGARNMCPCCGR
ncbi:hypothetical protein A5658_25965 [Mycobacterium sp. 1245111.1]|nr:hypothetical protein A5658_25965 [Mycobacterium sp. 1245111.1]